MMDFDEYNRRITAIHDELQAIANQTFNQAMVGTANGTNPAFVALMRRHGQLIRLASEINDRMMAALEESNYK